MAPICQSSLSNVLLLKDYRICMAGSTGTSDIQVQLSVTSVRAVPLCTAGSSSQAAGESGEQHCQRYADMRYKLMTWNPGSDI